MIKKFVVEFSKKTNPVLSAGFVLVSSNILFEYTTYLIRLSVNNIVVDGQANKLRCMLQL